MSNIKIIGKIGQFTTTKKEDVDVDNIIWHVNKKMGEITNFKWDLNHDMKGKIKNFNVAIWPQWNLKYVKNNNNYPNITNEPSFYINNLSLSGGIVLDYKLIDICNNYAKKIGATFNPYLLIPDNSLKCSNVGDIVLAVNQVMDLLNIKIKKYNTKNNENVKKCSGILIEQEAKYQQSGNPVINATNIFAALRSKWREKMTTSNYDINTPIAWSEQGPMDNIFAYDDPKKLFDKFSKKKYTISPPDYTWPDLYEAGWKGNWKWKEEMLINCFVKGNIKKIYIQCDIKPSYISTYSMVKELYGHKDTYKCTGSSGGTPDGKDPTCNTNNIKKNYLKCNQYNSNCEPGTQLCPGFKYSIPANKWGDLCKKNWDLSPQTNLYNMTFVAGGPGANFAIQNSGFGIGKECPNQNDIHTLQDLVDNIQTNFGTEKWTKDGRIFKSRTIALYG